jgi:hypothetical protein
MKYMGLENLEALKKKLEQLNHRLQELSTSALEDIEVATQIQKLLHPNRLEKVPGIRCVSRFIQGAEKGSEGFDVFTTDAQNRGSWYIANQTESFGLSSMLVQTLIYLTTRLQKGQERDLTPIEFFKILYESFANAKKKGKVRLLVTHLNHQTLAMRGVSRGFSPLLVRERKSHGILDRWNFEKGSSQELDLRPEFFEAFTSHSALKDEDICQWSMGLTPGSRVAFLSPSWSGVDSWHEYKRRASTMIQVSNILGRDADQGTDLIDDLNSLVMGADSTAQKEQRKCDITSVVWDIDSTKLQLKIS